MELTTNEIAYDVLCCEEIKKQNNIFHLLDEKIQAAISDSDGVIQQMCAHIANSGGKRIRPQLVLSCGTILSNKLNDTVINAAVAAELIHMASLVHDDIIDRSPLRRNKPSVNKLWGNHAAVLCGDWLFAKAFGILSGRGMDASMAYMVEAIQAMCQGEIIQACNKNNIEVSLETYYMQITYKTAKFLECCCKAGAVTGKASYAGIKAAGEFGLNIGLAFQIIDDILDLSGTAKVMGKPKGEDLRQGIITLPVILLLQDGEAGGQAKELLAKGNCNAQGLAIINGLLSSSGALKEAYRIAWSFIDTAQRSLDEIPDSESKVFLHKLATNLRHRVS